MHKLDTVEDFYRAGYLNGKQDIPPPAPGFGPTAKHRAAYIEGWRKGKDER